MCNEQRKTLAVIGAGPKGLAVAVKAKVLEELGVPVQKVILIERHSVAANWSGEAGYTNGELKLGTSPEKDVVFPMETTLGQTELDKKIRSRLRDFTWQAFLVDKGTYSDWVDRGRPAPCHKKWAKYLTWVADQLAPQVQIIKGQVQSIHISEKKEWVLELSDQSITADGLMLTGPGKTKINFGNGPLPDYTYCLETFWSALRNGTLKKEGKLAVIGAGENAASILLALSSYAPELEIELISPKGFISTRAENYLENQFYSRPLQKVWSKLMLEDRKDFIRRTDLGVFSVEAMTILNSVKNHNVIPGRVTRITSGARLRLSTEYAGEKTEHEYDQVVLATGFDQMASLRELLTQEALIHMEDSLKIPLTNEAMSECIDFDLSVNGLTPALHLPMLAGLSQGPGFANLSCLGLLSDRILLNQRSL